MLLPRLALASTFVGAAVAQFAIISPGGPNDWWGTCLSTHFFLRPLITTLSSRPIPEYSGVDLQ